MTQIRLKRVYGKMELLDGCRILVDRLWPRGLSKEKAKIDFWLKEIAPSPELRRWFSHDPAKWKEFQKKYAAELKKNPQAVVQLKKMISGRNSVTLVFAASDENFNNAMALKKILKL